MKSKLLIISCVYLFKVGTFVFLLFFYRCTGFVFLPRCSESFESAILCPCEEYHIQRRGSPGLTEREDHFCKNKCEHRMCAHSVIAHPLRVQPIFYRFVGDITSFAKNTPVIPQMLSSQLPTDYNAVTLYNTSIGDLVTDKLFLRSVR